MVGGGAVRTTSPSLASSKSWEKFGSSTAKTKKKQNLFFLRLSILHIFGCFVFLDLFIYFFCNFGLLSGLLTYRTGNLSHPLTVSGWGDPTPPHVESRASLNPTTRGQQPSSSPGTSSPPSNSFNYSPAARRVAGRNGFLAFGGPKLGQTWVAFGGIRNAACKTQPFISFFFCFLRFHSCYPGNPEQQAMAGVLG